MKTIRSGGFITWKREGLNLSKSELAKLINVDRYMVVNWEFGRSIPSRDHIHNVFETLKFSEDHKQMYLNQLVIDFQKHISNKLDI